MLHDNQVPEPDTFIIHVSFYEKELLKSAINCKKQELEETIKQNQIKIDDLDRILARISAQ
jgi:hypothetical protein